MCLVPVDLGTPQLAADNADRGDSLEFTPTTPTVPSPQPRELANRPPDGDGLDVADRPDDLEVHAASSLDRSRRTTTMSGAHQRVRSIAASARYTARLRSVFGIRAHLRRWPV